MPQGTVKRFNDARLSALAGLIMGSVLLVAPAVPERANATCVVDVCLPEVPVIGSPEYQQQVEEYVEEWQNFVDMAMVGLIQMMNQMLQDQLVDAIVKPKLPPDVRCTSSLSESTRSTSSTSDDMAREAAAREVLSLGYLPLVRSIIGALMVQSVGAIGVTVYFADGGSERYTFTPVYGGSTLNVRAVPDTRNTTRNAPVDCSL